MAWKVWIYDSLNNWKIKISKGLINWTNRCYFWRSKAEENLSTIVGVKMLLPVKHGGNIQTLTNRLTESLSCVFNKVSMLYLEAFIIDASIHLAALVSAVSISRFVFCVLLMVFQITGEKRPSSEMMKPKPKPPKKKKKKDPNEPTKPVSAYALFFRDTQAAIKGQNPNATFGDVSKIVASMWDGLGEEQKQVDYYSQITENWLLIDPRASSVYDVWKKGLAMCAHL